MAYFHGIKSRQVETSISTPVTAASGITFVVGIAPVHTVSGSVNIPVYGGNNNEAISALGYSDAVMSDGSERFKYNLCEVMYNHFRLYATAPVIFVNVLDPEKHKKMVESMPIPLVEGRAILPLEAILESVTVENYEAGEDFDLLYDGNALVLEVLEGGSIPVGTTELTVTYTEVDPSQVTKADIIGGFNVNTKKTTGFELIEAVFPKYGIAPDIIICPGWSHDAEVAAIMNAKSQGINGVFEAKALCDVDTSTVTHYADVTAWKKAQNIFSKNQVLCFPLCKLGDRVFHMSTQMAGLIATVDVNNGDCPAESPSNKHMQINSTVLADGTEVLLDLQQANYLNSNGVVTALNFIGGFVLWGNETACYPSNTDVKDYFLCVSRMFGWVANSIVLTYWGKIDKKFTRRLVESIVDSVNIWLNGLKNEEKILGGRVEFRHEENSLTALMSGKAVFHIYMTPPSPGKELEFVLEYSVDYVKSALSA